MLGLSRFAGPADGTALAGRVDLGAANPNNPSITTTQFDEALLVRVVDLMGVEEMSNQESFINSCNA
jgi:hypothetical protein